MTIPRPAPAILLLAFVAAALAAPGDGPAIKPPPELLKLAQQKPRCSDPKLRAKLLLKLRQDTRQEERKAEQARGKPPEDKTAGPGGGGGRTGSTATNVSKMQTLFDQNALRSLRDFHALRAMPGSQPLTRPGHLEFAAPFDDWGLDVDSDNGCWGAGMASPNAGTVWATGSSSSLVGYARAQVLVWVEQAFTAPRAGNMTVTLKFRAIKSDLAATVPDDYLNESNSKFYGFVCHPNQDTWKQELVMIQKVPPPHVSTYDPGAGTTKTVTLPTVPVSLGDPILVGAGLRQYDRARYGGVSAGYVGAQVERIIVDVD